MKTLEDLIYYYEDSAYVYGSDFEAYARENNLEDESALNNIEGFLSGYDLIEIEPDGRIIFHKKNN